jgi:hypothetical protein
MQVRFAAIEFNDSIDLISLRSQNSVVCIVIRIRATRFGVESRTEQDCFIFSEMSRSALESIQCPIHGLPGLFPCSGREVRTIQQWCQG